MEEERDARKPDVNKSNEELTDDDEMYLRSNSLFCLDANNPLRSYCIYIVSSVWFDRFILCVILINCVFLALYDPVHPDSTRSRVGDEVEIYFAVIFAMEMCIKVIAFGFVLHDGSYLRDPWNRLDFFIVCSGFLTYFFDSNITGIRAIRVLRPLRAVSGVGKLRIIVNSIVQSIPRLGEALSLFAFSMFMFSTLALQYWIGVLHQKCYVRENDGSYVRDPKEDDDPISFCSMGNSGRKCHEDAYCLPIGRNPNYGVTSFDNIGWSSLSIFQCVTLEGWVDIMYYIQDAFSGLSALYFVLLIFVFSFFLINLTLVVINDVFQSNVEREKQKEISRKMARLRRRDLSLKKITSNPSFVVKSGDSSLFGSSSTNDLKQKNSRESLDAFNKMTFEGESGKGKESSRKNKNRGKCVLFFVAISLSCRRIILHPIFLRFVTLLIVLNTMTMATEHHGMSDDWKMTLIILNYIFTALFTLEMIMKWIGLTWKEYVEDRFNIFDAVVVFFSILDIILGSAIGFSALRAFRLLRIFRVARSWKTLRSVLAAVLKSMESVLALSGLLLLIIFIFSLLGMQFFGGKFNFPEGTPRENFDSLYWALITVFQVITGENWNMVMYSSIRASGFTASLFFILIIIFGNYMILNLFIAILLQNLGETDKDSPGKRSRIHHLPIPTAEGIPFIALNARSDSSEENNSNTEMTTKEKLRERFRKLMMCCSRTRNYSCGFLAPESRVRMTLQKVIESKLFESLVLFLIVLGAVVLAMDNPRNDSDSDLAKTLYTVNIVLVVLFSIEATMKIIAYGFVYHEGAYLRDSWNRLDFFAVIVSVLAVLMQSSTGNAFRVVRVIRIVRTLRLIGKGKGIKVVASSLLRTLHPLFNVGMIALLFFIIFGILGIQLFAGRFYHCSGDDIDGIGDRQQCALAGERWINRDLNFDNIIRGLLTLFVISTSEGWVDVMHWGVDVTSLDEEPRTNNKQGNALYFVAFIIMGNFFVMNLFVGVVIDTYYKMVEKSEYGTLLLTKEQKEWVEIRRKVSHVTRDVRPWVDTEYPQNRIRAKIFSLVASKKFEMFILVLIVLNAIIIASEHYNQSENWGSFVWIFVLEAILKMIGLGFKQYFQQKWNIFDFTIISVSVLELMIDSGSGISVLRVIRLARVVRLIRKAKGIRRLLSVLWSSVPSLVNVGSLVGILFFSYAVVGVQLFSKVKRNGALNRHANFEDFFSALLLLFRAVTGEGWQDLMFACMVSEPGCDESKDNCGTQFAPIYFMTFVIIGAYILLNLFIAVILENFSELTVEEGLTLKNRSVKEFKLIWRKLDPDGVGSIDVRYLPLLIECNSPPIGTGGAVGRWRMMRFISKLDITVHDGTINFYDTFVALTKRTYGRDLPEAVQRAIGDGSGPPLPTANPEVSNQILRSWRAIAVLRNFRETVARRRNKRLKRLKEEGEKDNELRECVIVDKEQT